MLSDDFFGGLASLATDVETCAGIVDFYTLEVEVFDFTFVGDHDVIDAA